jgi:hypothetical protein
MCLGAFMTRSDRFPARIAEALQSSGIELLFDPHACANRVGHRTVWLITDYHATPLHPHFPLIDDITAGRGIGLQLLQHNETDGTWHLVRELRRGASCQYDRSTPDLQQAINLLLEQALIDLQLGNTALGSRAVSVARTAHRLRAISLYRLRGAWNHWKHKQLARWHSEFWRIGVIDAPRDAIMNGTELPPIRWITPEQADGYWADPFSLPTHEQRLVCEYFDEQVGVGYLEELALDAQDTITQRTRLPVGNGKHMSFPYVFMHEGRTLAVPESVSGDQCDLFEVDFNGTWHFLSTLLPQVQAADPAIFLHDGRWWLAFTDASIGNMDNLCIYYADQLQGPWLPHANNPVKVDICGARMAGAPFIHEGALHRPGQVCLPTYGSAIAVYRIDKLTPTAFAETMVKQIQPDLHGSCPHGLHTLSTWGNRTLVDGKRHGINYRNIVRKLLRRIPFGKRPPHVPSSQSQ